ncbi:MAG: ABC transporter substrate-binding protein [Acidimicrobiales bacterium]
MRHRNVLRSVIAIGTSVLLSSALCSSVDATPRAQTSYASDGGTFVVAATSGVESLDPDTVTNIVDFQALGLVYDQLVRYDKKLQLVPDLATNWAFSDGNQAITFWLRRGVTFDDGSVFTSANVVASLTRALAPKTGDASASYLSAVKSVVPEGRYVVELVLSRPDSSILSGLTSVNLSMLSIKAIAAGTVATKLDGTGPYVFSSWSPGNYLILNANRHYWHGSVRQASVKIEAMPTSQSISSAIRANAVQLGLFTQPGAAKPSTGDRVQRVLDLSYRALMLQDKTGPLANVNNRRALACAINRQQIVNDAVSGQGQVVGPIPVGPFASNPISALCPTTDLATAKNYLELAGDPSGFSFTAITSVDLDPTSLAQAKAVQSELAQVGINMNIQNLASGAYDQLWLKGDFQAAFAWNGADPDPYAMYGRYFGQKADLGVPAGYSSPRLQNLLAEGDESSSAAKRMTYYQELSATLTRNAVWVWLFSSYDYAVLGKGVDGFTFLPSLTDSLQTLALTSVS